VKVKITIDRTTIKKNPRAGSMTSWVSTHYEPQEIRHLPAPKYTFEYQAHGLGCRNCHCVFEHTKLGPEGECPKCDSYAGNYELEYETIEEARAKRNGSAYRDRLLKAGDRIAELERRDTEHSKRIQALVQERTTLICTNSCLKDEIAKRDSATTTALTQVKELESNIAELERKVQAAQMSERILANKFRESSIRKTEKRLVEARRQRDEAQELLSKIKGLTNEN